MVTFFTFVGCCIGVLFGLYMVLVSIGTFVWFRDSAVRTGEAIWSIIFLVLGCSVIYYSVHYMPFTIGLS